MDKRFPWGIIASLVVIASVSVGGGYLLYRIIDSAKPLKAGASEPRSTGTPPAAAVPSTETSSGTPGYLVVHLRAAAEMSPDTGDSAFDAVLENKGFATECPGKVVTNDHRGQAKDFWSEEEGATADTDSVVCLPAFSTVSGEAFAGETSPGRVTVDDTDAAEFPDEVFRTQGRSLFVETGKAKYMLYAGGISAKRCKGECEGGVAVGVSVTRVSRPLPEDRFVFSVPVGDSRAVNVAASAPMAQ
jgi:hypothetical protein